ncbi:hypothetical protein RQP53_14940 [Paucibacter sp. APW11]|uniref:Uncharacterized protein n=1 Tax=Roseateles aquae TaxID=3077235 RepID=A0ABU3PEP9_9BURK|nr:hypothetical protein [Paucibacter sp. APW11]MDT9000568.1 hypothetical protein [Paucibacter sp. APW11]
MSLKISCYSDIKQQIMDAYYDGCIGVGLVRGRSHEEVVGWVMYNFEDAFERPIEKLMQYVVGFVLVGNWYPAAVQIKGEIEGILSDCNLDLLLAELPEEDASMLRHDLKVLKFIV